MSSAKPIDPPPTAAIYARVSTDDQAREGHSLPEQQQRGRELIEREGWTFAGVYEDPGRSGADRERPELARLLADTAAGEIDVVLVTELNRLSRDAGHLRELLLHFDAAGTRVHAAGTELDRTSAEGRLHTGILSEFAEFERMKIRDRTRAGVRAAFDQGKRGGPVPDGYERVDESVYRRDPTRAPIIQLAFDLYERGLGDSSVARELNRRGHRTKTGRPFERRRIQDMLTNRFYRGQLMRHRGKEDERVRDGDHPRLIDPARFERLLFLRASRDRAVGSDRNPRGRPRANHALAGLARCGQCGEPMRPVTRGYRRKDGSRRRVYQCQHIRAATGLCDAPSIDAEVVDSVVIAKLDSYLGDFDAWRSEIESGHVAQRQRMAKEVEKAERGLADVRHKVGLLEKDYERALDDDPDNASAIVPLLNRRRAEAERASARVRAATDALAAVPTETPADAMLDFYNALGRAVHGRLDGADSMARVNAALRDLFDRFDLLSTEAGVLIRPLLDAAAAERIMGDAVERIGSGSWPDGFAMGHQHPDGIEPIPLLARESEPIVPPLRSITAPSAKSVYSHE